MVPIALLIDGSDTRNSIAVVLWFNAQAGGCLQVMEISQRLVQLQWMLGEGGDIDLVWMVMREPGLLTADVNQVMQRLINIKLESAGTGIDVVKLVEKQPALLLQVGGPIIGEASKHKIIRMHIPYR